jgi:hypothetical protein
VYWEVVELSGGTYTPAADWGVQFTDSGTNTHAAPSLAGELVYASGSTTANSPTGAAGGDLTGTYPDPTLDEIITASTKGDADSIPQITYDAKGRLTAVSEVSVSGAGIDTTAIHSGSAAGGALAGTYPNPTLAVVTAFGVYTPTRSAEANLDSNVTMSEAQYMRVGNTVTVSGQFTANPTTTATLTSFEITLPVASNIGAVEDVSGVAACGAISGMCAAISGSVANDTAVVTWLASDVAAQSWSYQFSFQVIP